MFGAIPIAFIVGSIAHSVQAFIVTFAVAVAIAIVLNRTVLR
jgi:ABC-type phosphate transport system permease subunit